MQLSDTMGACGGAGPPTTVGAESCRFPKLEECAHFHYERVQLPKLDVKLEGDVDQMDKSLHSQHTISSLDGGSTDPSDHYTLQVTCREECWLIQRTFDNFAMLDAQLHQCIYDRKVSQLVDLTEVSQQRKNANKDSDNDNDVVDGNNDDDDDDAIAQLLSSYLDRLCSIIDNSLNCGPILNWFQLDNRGHRLLVPSEESRSINTPAVAAAYSVRKYVSQARDELSLEVGDMISVIDMANPGESVWWRGKRGFQVGFFPQHCVHIIGDKVPRNMPLPPPVVGSLAISPIKPVLRKHGKLITFFRSFILNRPSRRRLKQSGILKERVFGCDLGEHLLNSGHDIPMVLKCCAEFIESHGIVDGIYRLSGVTSNIQKLRNAFDEDRIPNLYTDDILQDIHSVASLLKMYFRELPNPLCTYQLYHSFVAAVQGCSASRNKSNDNERLLKMREAVQKLPPPHYRTLEYLMRHLSRIAAHGPRTGMTTRNVAIVWAPNLLRCEELEIGGVAALQGVGVQAVVTEFLVCYADLIFSERVPPTLEEGLTRLSNVERELQVSPKRTRPKSLALSTPTKLLTLEEARNKHLLNKSDDGAYIEVGGGPKTLPKKYHTVIELPAGGSRKRGLAKRSPSGWRSFFSKSRNSSHGNLTKRDVSSPGVIPVDKSLTDSDLSEIKRKLRPVKSAESLTSGHSEPPTSDGDVLGPLYSLQKSSGHNRSVSHDSYFDNLQSSQNNSVGSLLDLSEIQLNFELEESEMRIFSEDESLVSSPKVQKENITRKTSSRSRFEDTYSNCTNSSNPSPKKQPRVVLSPDSMSRKRSRLEDQFSDIQYIDCNTPENPCIISTTAQIHQNQDEFPKKDPKVGYEIFEAYQPKNKSPRNSSDVTNRYSLNLEKVNAQKMPKSRTETDFKQTSKSHSFNLTPTPQTPNYKPLDSTGTTNTPILSPDTEKYSNFGNFVSSDATSEEKDLPSLNDATYQNLTRVAHRFDELRSKRYSNNFDLQLRNFDEKLYEEESSKTAPNSPNCPNYENILTTISIVYKSPVKSRNNSENIYEDIELNPEQAEKAVIPTTAASLPSQEASQPQEDKKNDDEVVEELIGEFVDELVDDSPTSLSAKVSLETTFDVSITTISSDTLNSAPRGHSSMGRPLVDDTTKTEFSDSLNSSPDNHHSNESNPSNQSNESSKSNKSLITPTNDDISDVEPKSTDSSSTRTSPKLSSSNSENLENPDKLSNCTTQLSHLDITEDDLTQNELSPDSSHCKTIADKRKSCDAELIDENTIYQQVKYFRRSIHEINSLFMEEPNVKGEPKENVEFDSLEPDNVHLYENVAIVSSTRDDKTDSSQMQRVPDLSRIRMHENTPKKLDMSGEDVQELPVCSKCSDDLIDKHPSFIDGHVGLIDEHGILIDEASKHGNLINDGGKLINERVNFIHERGNLIDEHINLKGHVNLVDEHVHLINERVNLKGHVNLVNQHPNLRDIHPNIKDKHPNIKDKHPNIKDKHVNLIDERVNLIDGDVHLIDEHALLIDERVNFKGHVNLVNQHPNLKDKHPNLKDKHVNLIDERVHLIDEHSHLIDERLNLRGRVNLKDKHPYIKDKHVNLIDERVNLIDEPVKLIDEPVNLIDEQINFVDEFPDEPKGNVRSLTNKFEPKHEPEPASSHKIVKQHNYDKDNLPPCLRAKNAKNSIKTRSLDENAFVTEFGQSNPNLQRRKSLDDRTSSYIDSKLLVASSTKLSSASTSDIRQDSKQARPSAENSAGSEQKLNRERIEKYKEERRNFWREKYRSESFKEDNKDKLLSRLKQKSFKTSKSDLSEPKIDVTTAQTTTETKKLSNEVFSKFEQSDRDGAVNKGFRGGKGSPHAERKNRPSLKELSDKLLDDATDELGLLRGSKEDEFLRHRRGDSESERRRHTYDTVRERESDDRDRRVSLESKNNHRKEKCSPSYCIKDMKAIFESKSQQ